MSEDNVEIIVEVINKITEKQTSITQSEKVYVKKNLESIQPQLIKIVRKYEEEFEEESNEDDVEQILSTDEVEKLLDSKVNVYNKFNENHPMQGITWDASLNKYKIQYSGLKLIQKH